MYVDVAITLKGEENYNVETQRIRIYNNYTRKESLSQLLPSKTLYVLGSLGKVRHTLPLAVIRDLRIMEVIDGVI